MSTEPVIFIDIDGSSLTPEILVNQLGNSVSKIRLTKEARDRVAASRADLEELRRTGVHYGVNTGFGPFAAIRVTDEQTAELQRNLIRSHCCGVGEPLSLQMTRMMLALRINVLAIGKSGMSLENLERMVAIFNSGCLPMIPSKGSVGASGDLAPLAHLARGMMGEGKMWLPSCSRNNVQIVGNKYIDASEALCQMKLEPIVLGAKEGLAAINGTQYIVAHAALALVRAETAAVAADVIAAMTGEAVFGCVEQYTAGIHETRPHPGQIEVAAHMRELLPPVDGGKVGDQNYSEIYNSDQARACRDIKRQDAYSLRGVPQIHGPTRDILRQVRVILTTEMNSATDNPMVLDGEIVSGGNFHGQYPSEAADMLAMTIATLGNVSERRIDRLMNPAKNNSGLPAFLIPDGKGGLHSGFMITQYTAAALASENKTLVHPASTDTIDTSCGQEDHVSMGAFAARKAVKVVENVETILGIEMYAACQALDLRVREDNIRMKTTAILEQAYETVRQVIPTWDGDHYMADEMETVFQLLRAGAFNVRPAKVVEAETASSTRIKPRIPAGTRDFGPKEMAVRQKVFDIITSVYKRHGAITINTPAFELKQVLTGKYGEDSKLIYDLADQGEGEESHLSLRYDLTVPFARYCAMNGVIHMKRYQIAKVWRRDSPTISRGRYREFFQCDLDIAGHYPALIPDAECLQIMREVFLELAIGDFQISVNHRGLLDGMMEFCGVPENLLRPICSAIDKLDKNSWEDVRQEMIEKGLTAEAADGIGEFVKIKFDREEIGQRLAGNEKATKSLDDMKVLFEYLDAFGCASDGTIVFDLTLARGLDYYTGVIFEARLTGTNVGSVGGGGRYDELIGMFTTGRKIPSVGFSIGIERIFAIMEKQALDNVKVCPTQVLVASAGGNLTTDRMKICQELWAAGIGAEFLYKKNPKMQQQIEYCLDNQISYMVVIGRNELEQGVVQVKDIVKETKTDMRRGEYIAFLQGALTN